MPYVRVSFRFCAVTFVCGAFCSRFVRPVGGLRPRRVVSPFASGVFRLCGRGAVFLAGGCRPVCLVLGAALAARVPGVRGSPGSGWLCGVRSGGVGGPGGPWPGVPCAGRPVRRPLWRFSLSCRLGWSPCALALPFRAACRAARCCRCAAAWWCLAVARFVAAPCLFAARLGRACRSLRRLRVVLLARLLRFLSFGVSCVVVAVSLRAGWRGGRVFRWPALVAGFSPTGCGRGGLGARWWPVCGGRVCGGRGCVRSRRCAGCGRVFRCGVRVWPFCFCAAFRRAGGCGRRRWPWFRLRGVSVRALSCWLGSFCFGFRLFLRPRFRFVGFRRVRRRVGFARRCVSVRVFRPATMGSVGARWRWRLVSWFSAGPLAFCFRRFFAKWRIFYRLWSK